MSARRRAVDPDTARVAAHDATRHLLADAVFGRTRRIALYAALPDELPSRPLFEALAGSGRERLMPRCVDRGLAFARVDRWEDLRPGRYGVLEPPEEAPVVEPVEGDAVVVPGVAFDAAGGRLGRGRGYYDRTFAPDSGRSPLLVGFGYAFQLVDRVPADERDRRIDAIVTERGMRWFRRDWPEGPESSRR